jgi:NADPH2:quinone reductase
MLALFGQSSGRVPPIDPMTLTEKGSLFLSRPSLVHYIADRKSLLERASKVLDWVATGALKPRIGEVYPLARVPDAYRDLEARKTTGKLIIDVAR